MTRHTWHSGPPPFPGWWEANTLRQEGLWRWWDGRLWSLTVGRRATALEAGNAATRKSSLAEIIQWTNYWPEGARVPRIDPRKGGGS